MAPTGFVDALWVGYPARLDKPGHPQDGIDLIPGETVVQGLAAGEAEESSHWQPQTRPEKPLEKRTKTQLAELAAERGIEIKKGANRGAILEAILQADAAPITEPDPEPEPAPDEGGEV